MKESEDKRGQSDATEKDSDTREHNLPGDGGRTQNGQNDEDVKLGRMKEGGWKDES